MGDPNREHWEQLATMHGTGADRYHDLDKLIAGGTLMGAEEAAALVPATGGEGVADLDVLHLSQVARGTILASLGSAPLGGQT